MKPFEQVWAETRIDGALPEDGDYYGIVTKNEFKSSEKGYEIHETVISVTEGPAAGEEVKVSIFYHDPNNPEKSKRGIKSLKTLISRTSPLLNLDNFQECVNFFPQQLTGRKVRFTQKTNGEYVNHYIREVFDADPQVLNPPSPPTNPGLAF
jgi:hypothetical protein